MYREDEIRSSGFRSKKNPKIISTDIAFWFRQLDNPFFTRQLDRVILDSTAAP